MAYTGPMRMSTVYDENHILVPVEARNKDELFRLLAHAISEREDLDEARILEGLRSREAMMDTMLAPGIALPHTQLKDFPRSTGLLAVIPGGCEYGDGNTIRIAAMVVDSDSDPEAHLDTLRSFALMARNPRFLEKIVQAANPSEVRTLLRRFEAQS